MAKNIRFTRFTIEPIGKPVGDWVGAWRIRGKSRGISVEALIGSGHEDRKEVDRALGILESVLNKRLQQQQEILGLVDDDPANMP